MDYDDNDNDYQREHYTPRDPLFYFTQDDDDELEYLCSGYYE
jgi:hypothetical protein